MREEVYFGQQQKNSTLDLLKIKVKHGGRCICFVYKKLLESVGMVPHAKENKPLFWKHQQDNDKKCSFNLVKT